MKLVTQKVHILGTAALILAPASCLGGITGAVRGEVLSQSGSPVPNAVVVMEETGAEARTSSNGFFVFVGVDPGAYTLLAAEEGEVRCVVRGVLVHADLSSKVTMVMGSGAANVSDYSEVLRHEPGTMFILSRERVLSLPLKLPAQCIRTVPSRVELEKFF